MKFLPINSNILKFLFVGILSLATFTLVYSPHFSYPWPYHVDEWQHITQTLKLETVTKNIHPEIGFHLLLYPLSKATSLVDIYKFLPGLWVMFSALALFWLVYKKTDKNYWLACLSILFFASLKSNANILGPWFFTPLTFSFPFIFLYILFFTDGIEKRNKQIILAGLVTMLFLVPIHALSVLFAIPIFIIYGLFHYRYILRDWKFFSLFLSLPALGLLFYQSTKNLPFTKVLDSLYQDLQFSHGWGILERSNNPTEIYSLIGLVFAAMGVAYIFWQKKHRQYLIFLIWPITILGFIAFFKIFDVSPLIPYQRALYYWALSLPFLSAYGLYSILKSIQTKTTSHFQAHILNTLIVVISLWGIFHLYYKTPERVQLYKLVEAKTYTAINFLATQPDGRVLTTPEIGTVIYPLSGKQSTYTIAFSPPKRKDHIKTFFSSQTTCKQRLGIISRLKVTYVLSPVDIPCAWKILYNDGTNKIYAFPQK